jgi:hypothetical protein
MDSIVTGLDVAGRMLFRRAVEAVVWGMPAVNYRMMYDAAASLAGPGDNRIVFWTGLLDWRNQTLTPNPDVIYLMPFLNTKDVGPMVLEIPPADDGALNGSVMNYWQVAIEDIGPAGIDAGRGGRCVIVPPGYDGEVPADCIVLRSDTFHCYALVRSVLSGGSDAEIERAVAYARRIKLYPLSAAESPPDTVWIDATDTLFDAAIPYDIRFFRALHAIVQEEPWLDRDRAMIDPLKAIGIEQSRPFEPDEPTVAILEAAITEAHEWLDTNYESLFVPYNEGTRWALPVTPELIKSIEAFFDVADSYPIDARGTAYSFAFFSSKHLGKGQFYLVAIRDADGHPFDGGATYRLTVPADAPVTQYWSATLYDRGTHTLIREVSRAGRSSQSPGLLIDEGTVVLHLGPTPPAGREANWIPTDPAREFEVLFRFYGPQPSLFDKTWRLPDIERVTD